MSKSWYKIEDTSDVVTPALLVYPKRVEENILTMIEIAGGTEKLRPHIKTYKMAEVIRMQLKQGISKFKCATIPEAQLLAESGARDVLLAMQPVGANINRFVDLIQAYPDVAFSTIVDNQSTVKELSEIAPEYSIEITVWVDINNGMHRTGVQSGDGAIDLYKQITASQNLRAKGLHVYDGHIHETDFKERKIQCDDAFKEVLELKDAIEEMGMDVETIVAGGTPTFPIHAKRKGVEVSPGTTLLWDQGYADAFPDLKFQIAAVLLTRIVSKPSRTKLCFDLGHKSVASEMSLPRVSLLEGDGVKQVSQSEEHLVVETANTKDYNIGGVHYATPIHICPTVTKYDKVLTVENEEITGFWTVVARDH